MSTLERPSARGLPTPRRRSRPRRVWGSFLTACLAALWRSSAIFRRVGHRLSSRLARDGYYALREKFILNGRHSIYGEKLRSDIVARFEWIDRNVPLASTPSDGLVLAEALLSLDARGCLIECGCFGGGSTAKLSILAKLLERPLIVFDSFEGLPQVDEDNLSDYHLRRSSEWTTQWVSGRYGVGLEGVKRAVEAYGEISACTFFKGWFNETLIRENLPDQVAFAFTDVDIANSARQCLLAIYPTLSEGAIYFSHDIAYLKVVLSLTDRSLWRKRLKASPPVFFGLGYGMGDASPHLGFFLKGDWEPAYLKSLMINK